MPISAPPTCRINVPTTTAASSVESAHVSMATDTASQTARPTRITNTSQATNAPNAPNAPNAKHVIAILARQARTEGADTLGLGLQDLRSLALTSPGAAYELALPFASLRPLAQSGNIADLMRVLRGSSEHRGQSSASEAHVLRPTWRRVRLEMVCEQLRTPVSPDANAVARQAGSVDVLASRFRSSISLANHATDLHNANTTSAPTTTPSAALAGQGRIGTPSRATIDFAALAADLREAIDSGLSPHQLRGPMAHLTSHERAQVIEALCHRIAPWADIHAAEEARSNADRTRRRATKALCNVMTSQIATIPETDRSPLLNALWLLGTEPAIERFGVVNGTLDAESRQLLSIQLARWCVHFPDQTQALLARHPPLDPQQRITFAAALAYTLKVRDRRPVEDATALGRFGITPEEYEASLHQRLLPGITFPQTTLAQARVRAATLTLINTPHMDSPHVRDAYFERNPLTSIERNWLATDVVLDALESGQYTGAQDMQEVHGLSASEVSHALNCPDVQSAARRNHFNLRFIPRRAPRERAIEIRRFPGSGPPGARRGAGAFPVAAASAARPVATADVVDPPATP